MAASYINRINLSLSVSFVNSSEIEYLFPLCVERKHILCNIACFLRKQ